MRAHSSFEGKIERLSPLAINAHPGRNIFEHGGSRADYRPCAHVHPVGYNGVAAHKNAFADFSASIHDRCGGNVAERPYLSFMFNERLLFMMQAFPILASELISAWCIIMLPRPILAEEET